MTKVEVLFLGNFRESVGHFSPRENQLQNFFFTKLFLYLVSYLLLSEHWNTKLKGYFQKTIILEMDQKRSISPKIRREIPFYLNAPKYG